MSEQYSKYWTNHNKIHLPKLTWQDILTAQKQTEQSLQAREPPLLGSFMEITAWATKLNYTGR